MHQLTRQRNNTVQPGHPLDIQLRLLYRTLLFQALQQLFALLRATEGLPRFDFQHRWQRIIGQVSLRLRETGECLELAHALFRRDIAHRFDLSVLPDAILQGL